MRRKILSSLLSVFLHALKVGSFDGSGCSSNLVHVDQVYGLDAAGRHRSAAFAPNTTLTFQLGDCPQTLSFPCDASDKLVASQLCSAVLPHVQHCNATISTAISQAKARPPSDGGCSRRLEHWLDRTLRDFLTSLQWVILEESLYMGVKTWKFPMDAWVYMEIMHENPPDVLVEVGNRFGGSALLWAHLFDQMGAPTRIIAVDVDQSEVHELPRSHPRITWIENDAPLAFPEVAALIRAHETVMLVEDASHTHLQTLEIMEMYGSLVTPNQWMVIEDTVLHNGVRNDMFVDPGAFQSVKGFLTGPFGCAWNQDREKERYILTWNPSGFLRKKPEGGACYESPPHPALGLAAEWRLLGPDPLSVVHRDTPVAYDLLSISATSLHINHQNLAFVPRNRRGVREIFSEALAFCTQLSVPKGSLNDCAGLVVAKSLATVPSNQDTFHPLSPAEESPPISVPLSAETPKHVRTALTTGPGIAIIPGVLLPEAASRLRAVITSRPEYAKALEESQSLSTTTRYLHPLCEKSSSAACRPWGSDFISLLSNPTILQSVEKILGPGALVDNTAISITWPGHATFGPHVDRPFDANSRYASDGRSTPPKAYPVSLQVIWMLDSFNTANGAFFVMPGQFWAEDFPEHVYPVGAQMVTGTVGSAVIANGGLVHGAAPNFTPRPRIAVLVQYVRRFVRPFNKYSAGLLANTAANHEVEVLRQILDITDEEEDHWEAEGIFVPTAPHNLNPPSSKSLAMPLIAFGTGGSFAALSSEATFSAVTEALLAGYRHFDLAESYMNHAAVGTAFTAAFSRGIVARSDLFVTTKLWATNMQPDQVAPATENMLKDLQLLYIDLLLIHWPVPLTFTGDLRSPSRGEWFPTDEHGNFGYATGFSVVDTWESMEALVKAGRVNLLGVSNADKHVLHMLQTSRSKVPVSVNQLESHPALPQQDLVDFSRSRGVFPVAYAALGSSRGDVLRHPSILDVASTRRCASAAQVLIKWGLMRGTGVVVSSKDKRRMMENIRVDEECILSEEDLPRLTAGIKEERLIQPEAFRFLF